MTIPPAKAAIPRASSLLVWAGERTEEGWGFDASALFHALRRLSFLPDGARGTFMWQLRTLRFLGRFRAGDLVELEKLCEVLCDSCEQGMRHCLQEQCRTELLARQARKAQLRRMPFEEYRKTPEWKSLRNRVLILAGNRCQACGTNEKPLDSHHNTYERYGDELLADLTVLCRRRHEYFHERLPKAA